MLIAIRKFVELVAAVHQNGPVVEFGACRIPQQEITANLRPFFPGLEYTGMDVHEGPGVDIVMDCSNCPQEDTSVGTVIACEVLEHCERPTAVLMEANRILKEDGLLVVTTPFYFPLHHMPDFWRFSPLAMDMLLSFTPYRAVFYMGDIAMPRTVLSLAAKSEAVITRVLEGLCPRIGEIPSWVENDKIFRWTTVQDYANLRDREDLSKAKQAVYDNELGPLAALYEKQLREKHGLDDNGESDSGV